MAERNDDPDGAGRVVAEAKDPEGGNGASTDNLEDRREGPPKPTLLSWFRFVFCGSDPRPVYLWELYLPVLYRVYPYV